MAKIRLFFAKKLLPSGYAIWTWGVEAGDEPIISKESKEQDD